MRTFIFILILILNTNFLLAANEENFGFNKKNISKPHQTIEQIKKQNKNYIIEYKPKLDQEKPKINNVPNKNKIDNAQKQNSKIKKDKKPTKKKLDKKEPCICKPKTITNKKTDKLQKNSEISKKTKTPKDDNKPLDKTPNSNCNKEIKEKPDITTKIEINNTSKDNQQDILSKESEKKENLSQKTITTNKEIILEKPEEHNEGFSNTDEKENLNLETKSKKEGHSNIEENSDSDDNITYKEMFID